MGEWSWNQFPTHSSYDPWDVVGFYTQDPYYISAIEYFVYGYNDEQSGAVMYYNTDTNNHSGLIQKGEDTPYGAAFWLFEPLIDRGVFIAPLSYVSGSNTKVMMKYAHSWTETHITGIGGNVGINSAGFNVVWDTGVLSWPGVATSAGIRIPS